MITARHRNNTLLVAGCYFMEMLENIDGHGTWGLREQTLGAAFDALETQKERMVMYR